MTCATERYTIDDIHGIMAGGFECTLDASVIETIQGLATHVGAADYVRTPKFPKQSYSAQAPTQDGWTVQGGGKGFGGRRRKNRRAQEVVSDADWQAIRTFSATKLAEHTGIDANMATLRKHLNKLTESSYDTLVPQIKEEIGVVLETVSEGGEELSTDAYEELAKIGKSVFSIASGNAFFSNIYARLYKELMEEYGFMESILDGNLDEYAGLFQTIEHVDPVADYDRFCEINKENEQRRAMAKFFTNLYMMDVVSEERIVGFLMPMQDRVISGADDKEMVPVSQELAEVIFIFITQGWEKLGESSVASDIKDRVATVSRMTSSPGVSKKAVFKHMDIMDTWS